MGVPNLVVCFGFHSCTGLCSYGETNVPNFLAQNGVHFLTYASCRLQSSVISLEVDQRPE